MMYVCIYSLACIMLYVCIYVCCMYIFMYVCMYVPYLWVTYPLASEEAMISEEQLPLEVEYVLQIF